MAEGKMDLVAGRSCASSVDEQGLEFILHDATVVEHEDPAGSSIP
ncbi:MAG: hypothetical protein R2849_02790 [Thermomicrobiales bacterium]